MPKANVTKSSAKRIANATKPAKRAKHVKPATDIGASRITGADLVNPEFNALAATGGNTTTVAPVAAIEPVKPAEANAAPAKRAVDTSRITAHQAAARAVAEFYSGASKPFKAANDTFKPINFNNAKAQTTRQAALLLAMLTYSAGNIKADGTFVRGGFSVPAGLVFDAADLAKLGLSADTLLAAQPESGCLGNMLGGSDMPVSYVSGPTSGREQRNAVYRLNLPRARAYVQSSFGDKAASLFDSLPAAE